MSFAAYPSPTSPAGLKSLRRLTQPTTFVSTSYRRNIVWPHQTICSAQIAHQAFFLSVKRKGHTLNAIQNRLVNGQLTWVNANARLTYPDVIDNCQSQGAIGWHLEPTQEPFDHPVDNVPSSQSNAPPPSYLSLQDIDPSMFLLHWTRPKIGRWPDQSENEYLDDLVFRTSRSQHGVVHTLGHMLASQTIFASSEFSRANVPVVSLSEIRLDQLARHRVFRPHLARWDCLPYGLAILRTTLTRLGARPVIYGDQNTWDSLATSEQPYFQPASSRGGKIDWTTEKEWRIVGNLDLKSIGNDDAIFFVPSKSEASKIAKYCRWPVLVLD